VPLKPHPKDPDKLVFVKGEYNLQKPWIGLTDEELIELSESGLYLWELWKAIEAKLKEKNT